MTPRTNGFDADVLIAGAGPVGLMLAGELRLAGVTPVVVERLTEPIQQSRALGFSARTIEEFDQRGLLPRFGEINTIPMGHFGGLSIDFRVIESGSYGARGVPQAVTEAILADWATGLGTKVHRRYEVVGITQDDAGVGVEVSTPDGSRTMRARYVVGCDGAHSTVRRLTGIDFPGRAPTLEMWLADVSGVELRPRFSGEVVPGGMVMVLPMGPYGNRVVLYEREGPPRENPEGPTFREVADAWQRLTGEDIHHAEPRWVSWFTDSSRQASEYRRGRVLLAGDAARVHLPIGAQGLSAGVQDAVNLGWKLGAAVRGDAPPGLLDTYHSERHPAGARVVANTLAQRILYLGGDEVQALRDLLGDLMVHEEVQRHLVGMVTGLDLCYDVGPGDHPLLGRRMPEVDLAGDAGASGTSSSELLHPALGVVLDLADDAEVRAAAAPWADRVRVVTATARPDGDRGPLDGIAALLIRPDGYVAWVGADASSDGPPSGGPGDALTRWFGNPQA